jgi:hypothetical protein
MPEHLSDRELERMKEFAETPAYERDPEQLLPQSLDDPTGPS